MPFWNGSFPRLLRILIRSRTFTRPSALMSPVFVMQAVDSGHRVWIVGQTVHVPPVLSGHSVMETDDTHFVVRAGQDVTADGQTVCVVGQMVVVPEPSSQTVTPPVQTVCLAGHFVMTSGHSVAAAGQTVGVPAAAHPIGLVMAAAEGPRASKEMMNDER